MMLNHHDNQANVTIIWFYAKKIKQKNKDKKS
jgi:hypothetical protein